MYLIPKTILVMVISEDSHFIFTKKSEEYTYE
jgi:hypothetical protein